MSFKSFEQETISAVDSGLNDISRTQAPSESVPSLDDAAKMASVASVVALASGHNAKAVQAVTTAIQMADILSQKPVSGRGESLPAMPANPISDTGLPDLSDTGKVAPLDEPVIEEHPLAGQAVNDFAGKELPFAPVPVDTDAEDQAAGVIVAGITDFSENTRLLRFYASLPADKKLLIESFQGYAALSEAFVFHLTLISKNGSIDLQDVMGKNVTVGIQQADGSEQYINGYVSSFGFAYSDGGFAYYHAEVVPWLAYLTRRINCHVFQDKNVRQVLEEIFGKGYHGLAKYDFRLSKSYPPENYLVQYNESDENFVCRLMEKHGLFFYFEHSKDAHTLVISDDSCNAAFCPPQTNHPVVEFNAGNHPHGQDSVTHLAARRTLQSAKVALNTFDFKAPHTPQYVEVPTIAEQGNVPRLEVYDGNPAFSYKTRSEGESEAQQRMEVLEWQAKIFSGTSDCRGMIAGHTIKLTNHHWFDSFDPEDAHFLVLSVTYIARNNYFNNSGTEVYSNSFTCIRRKIPYRPRLTHKKPQMPGPQTATVVGPIGTEIYTDKFGRIKVQFHWDRYGRRDERSSCWIRVSQPWAGKDWGTISIPRIAQEVIIDYLEGDPDRPVCTGRLYNADQPAPYPLPDGAHMMGFKSRSTPGGGGYCEMVIHDKKGHELINIHSQKDMNTTVQNTQATVVNGPHQTNTVSKGFHVTTVHKHIEIVSQTQHIHFTASTDITLEVGASKIEMKADGTIKIQGVHVDVVGSSRIDLNK